jgi:hypothetical protein
MCVLLTIEGFISYMESDTDYKLAGSAESVFDLALYSL